MLDQTMRRAGDDGGNDDAYDQDEPVVAEQKARRETNKHEGNGDEMQTTSDWFAMNTQIKEPELLEAASFAGVAEPTRSPSFKAARFMPASG